MTSQEQKEPKELKSWETEDEDSEALPPKPRFEVKAHLVLVGSEARDWGIIEDTLNNLLWEPGKGEVVGTWSRPRYDNRIHISLATAISALQDRSIQTFKHYAEEYKHMSEGTKKASISKKSKKTKEQVQEPTPSLSVEEELKFNALRARLGRAK